MPTFKPQSIGEAILRTRSPALLRIAGQVSRNLKLSAINPPIHPL
jgi:hypothetical protein